MNSQAIFLSALMLVSGASFGSACEVRTRSQSEAIPSIESHTCYRFTKVADDAIGWSCSNESKEMLTSDKRRVEQCANHSVATCTATLTQESLANPHATSKAPGHDSPAIPQGAQVVTYYYDSSQLKQLRKDCESAGGRWQAP